MIDASESLTQRVEPLEAGEHVIAARFIGEQPVLALAGGTVTLGMNHQRVQPHGDAAILVASSDDTMLLTGGDDGKIIATKPDGSSTVLGDEKGKWIDAVAIGTSGATAWSTGKKVVARDGKGALKEWLAPTTAQGLAFAPKGYRLAISHYNGSSLWFPNTEGKPESVSYTHLTLPTKRIV